MIKLIVGLGNPEEKYQQTRHNLGFWFIDKIKSCPLPLRNIRNLNGELKQISVDNNNCIFVFKSYAGMNNSGYSIKTLIEELNISTDEVLIVHDEINFPIGRNELKFKGSSGGNNGIKNIILSLETDEFWRLRVGIDKPEDNSKLLEYVLSSPPLKDLSNINNNIDTLTNLIEIFARNPREAQQRINKRHTP